MSKKQIWKLGVVARGSLFFLATDDTINKCLAEALEYLDDLKNGDANKENITRIRTLERDYLNLITKAYNPKEYSAMAEDFVDLCIDIIKDNEADLQKMPPA
jgi:hypothetical protein